MAVIDSSVVVGDQEIRLYVEADSARRPVGNAFGHERDRAAREADRREDVFGQGMELAVSAAQRVAQTMDSMTAEVMPDSFQLQFGIRLDNESGAVITKNKGDAHLNITMNWDKGSKS